MGNSWKDNKKYTSGQITNTSSLKLQNMNILTNKITRSLNIFGDKKYDVIILSYYIFNFTC